jgi:hypothetical protein
MPRRNPIRLGPGREPALSLDQMAAANPNVQIESALPEPASTLDWPAIEKTLKLSVDAAQLFARSTRAGETRAAAGRRLGWSASKVDRCRQEIGRAIDAHRNELREVVMFGGGSSTKPVFTEHFHSGYSAYSLAFLGREFREIMATEQISVKVFSELSQKPFFVHVQGEGKVMNIRASIREQVDSVVLSAKSRPAFLDALAHLGKLSRDLGAKRDELTACIEQAELQRLRFGQHGEPSEVDRRAHGFLQGAEEQAISELGPRIKNLRLDIMALERACDLQARILDPLKEAMISEITLALRPLHQNILSKVDVAFREFSQACQAEHDLLSIMNDHKIPARHHIQRMTIEGFYDPESPNSRYQQWSAFVKKQGYAVDGPQPVDSQKRRPS